MKSLARLSSRSTEVEPDLNFDGAAGAAAAAAAVVADDGDEGGDAPVLRARLEGIDVGIVEAPRAASSVTGRLASVRLFNTMHASSAELLGPTPPPAGRRASEAAVDEITLGRPAAPPPMIDASTRWRPSTDDGGSAVVEQMWLKLGECCVRLDARSARRLRAALVPLRAELPALAAVANRCAARLANKPPPAASVTAVAGPALRAEGVRIDAVRAQLTLNSGGSKLRWVARHVVGELTDFPLALPPFALARALNAEVVSAGALRRALLWHYGRHAAFAFVRAWARRYLGTRLWFVVLLVAIAAALWVSAVDSAAALTFTCTFAASYDVAPAWCVEHTHGNNSDE